MPDPPPTSPEDRPHDVPASDETLLREIRELSSQLRRNTAAFTEFRWRFLGGLYQGVGTVVGATVVIAIIIRILARLATVEAVGPYIRDLQQMLERNPPPSSRQAPARNGPDPTTGEPSSLDEPANAGDAP